MILTGVELEMEDQSSQELLDELEVISAGLELVLVILTGVELETEDQSSQELLDELEVVSAGLELVVVIFAGSEDQSLHAGTAAAEATKAANAKLFILTIDKVLLRDIR